jgi:hypothetical protein
VIAERQIRRLKNQVKGERVKHLQGRPRRCVLLVGVGIVVLCGVNFAVRAASYASPCRIRAVLPFVPLALLVR